MKDRLPATATTSPARVLIAVLLATRVLWRATRGCRLPLADTRAALNVVAMGTH